MKFALFLFTLLFCAQGYAESKKERPADSIEWSEWKYPMQSDKGAAEITVLNPMYRGNTIQLDVRFTNIGFQQELYNVLFFNRSETMPATLAIFDEKHKYIDNLFRWTGGLSRQSSTIENVGQNWMTVPANCYIGTTINQRIYGLYFHFPPGTYYLQLVYNKSLVAPRPRNDEELAKFRTHGKWDELFRSNIVKIELVDKEAAEN